MSSETDLQHVLPAWLELASKTDVSLGLDPGEAFRRAETLLNEIRARQNSTESWAPEAEQVEVLHALVALVCREGDDPTATLRDIEFVADFISKLPWPDERFGGPRELQAACAFHAWRTARRFAPYAETQKFASRLLAASEARGRVEDLLSIPAAEREVAGCVDPQFLLCISETLRFRIETAPAKVREDGEFFRALVEESACQIATNDERDYFLGELALTVGTANRVLFNVSEAELWFRSAEASLSRLQDADAHSARIAYQRLALSMEERNIEEVLKAAPRLSNAFRRLGMSEDALKCHFLEGSAYLERGETQQAIAVYEAITAEADSLQDTRLGAIATSTLVGCLTDIGEIDRALDYARKALPLLKQLNSRVHLVKLQWGMGNLFRKQGNRSAAIDAYRRGLADALELGTRNDVVDLHLLVADLLLETGEEAQAEQEIRAALPIIEEEKMMTEGIAALSLLRESLRRQKIDRGALRDLHRHLEDRAR